MKDAKTKFTCFKLRAQGKSLATIADTVGVRRQTVANWLKEHHEEVENLKAMELDALREACWMTKQACIQRLSARHEKITAELEKRDFSDLSTEKLLEWSGRHARSLPASSVSRTSAVRRSSATRRPRERRPISIHSLMVKQGGDTTLLLEPEESGNGRKRRQAD